MMKSIINHIGNAGITKYRIAWLILVFLAVRLTAADTSSVRPNVKILSAGITGTDIQQALDSLPAAGGEVVLPAGTIEITHPIVIYRDNLTLRGTGPSTILHLADHANCPVIILGEAVNNPTLTVRHLLVTGFFIDGNRFHQDRELWRTNGEGSQIRNNGICIQGVSDSKVENVSIARCRSGGLVTTRDVRHLTVRGLESYDNQFDGLACYQTEQSLFADLSLHDNPGAGISLDLAFNNNVISNACLMGNDLGIFMRASRKNQFLNVAIHNAHHFGVFMADAERRTTKGWGPAPETECANNAFTNLLAMNCGAAAFRVNDTTCTNNIIISPKFAGNIRGGLSLVQPNLVTVQ